MNPEERYYANSDEGEVKRLRAELEAVRGQIKHWKYLKEHYHRENARLRKALLPFARHSLGGWNLDSTRRYSIRVTEGQVARAARALGIGFDPDD